MTTLRITHFRTASRSPASPTLRKSVFGINQIYELEVLRAEGVSPSYTRAHDEFVLSIDVEIHLVKLDAAQRGSDAEKGGAVLVQREPVGAKMGWMHIKRGHQALLPSNTAYQFRAAQLGVLVLQTCKDAELRSLAAFICSSFVDNLC
jgi:hypothetical protein